MECDFFRCGPEDDFGYEHQVSEAGAMPSDKEASGRLAELDDDDVGAWDD